MVCLVPKMKSLKAGGLAWLGKYVAETSGLSSRLYFPFIPFVLEYTPTSKEWKIGDDKFIEITSMEGGH